VAKRLKDKATLQAVARLKGLFVGIEPIKTSGYQVGSGKLTEEGVCFIFAVLYNAGFKIVKRDDYVVGQEKRRRKRVG
jgi:hypothetical protein